MKGPHPRRCTSVQMDLQSKGVGHRPACCRGMGAGAWGGRKGGEGELLLLLCSICLERLIRPA